MTESKGPRWKRFDSMEDLVEQLSDANADEERRRALEGRAALKAAWAELCAKLRAFGERAVSELFGGRR